jgi:hypothetical protein
MSIANRIVGATNVGGQRLLDASVVALLPDAMLPCKHFHAALIHRDHQTFDHEGDAALPLYLSNDLDSDRGLATGLKTENLDDAAAGTGLGHPEQLSLYDLSPVSRRNICIVGKSNIQ